MLSPTLLYLVTLATKAYAYIMQDAKGPARV